MQQASAQRLHVVEALVVAVLGEKLLVAASLHNLALVEDADLVGIADGGEAVGDGDSGAGLHEALQGLLHQALALRVEGRSGLVEYQDGRVLEDGTGYADALALATRELAAPVADVGS